MKLRQIRSFLSIAETLHFRRTAEMIHLSQPALSLQRRALEDEIGVRLFESNRRKTALSAAGVAFARMRPEPSYEYAVLEHLRIHLQTVKRAVDQSVQYAVGDSADSGLERLKL